MRRLPRPHPFARIDNPGVRHDCSRATMLSTTVARTCWNCSLWLLSHRFIVGRLLSHQRLSAKHTRFWHSHEVLQLSSSTADNLAKESTHVLNVNFNKIAPLSKENTAKRLQTTPQRLRTNWLAQKKRTGGRDQTRRLPRATRSRAATIKDFVLRICRTKMRPP